jgi:hypothetical protein
VQLQKTEMRPGDFKWLRRKPIVRVSAQVGTRPAKPAVACPAAAGALLRLLEALKE